MRESGTGRRTKLRRRGFRECMHADWASTTRRNFRYVRNAAAAKNALLQRPHSCRSGRTTTCPEPQPATRPIGWVDRRKLRPRGLRAERPAALAADGLEQALRSSVPTLEGMNAQLSTLFRSRLGVSVFPC